jgi:hypothetical protein
MKTSAGPPVPVLVIRMLGVPLGLALRSDRPAPFRCVTILSCLFPM